MEPRVRTALGLLALAAGLWPAGAQAIDSCKAKIDRKTGQIRVDASGVQPGLVRWGHVPDFFNQEFFNEDSCLQGDKLKKCLIGDPATAAAETPTASCRIHITDFQQECTARIQGCIPGFRQVRRAERFQDYAATNTDTTISTGVSCATDETLVGGGYAASANAASANVYENGPRDDVTNTWDVILRLPPGVPAWSLTIWAFCAK